MARWFLPGSDHAARVTWHRIGVPTVKRNVRQKTQFSFTCAASVVLLTWCVEATAEPAATAPTATFDPQLAQPAFRGTDASRTAEMFRAADFAGASSGLGKALDAGKIQGAAEVQLAELAAGYALLKQGKHKASIEHFDRAAASALLAPYALYYGGYASYHAGDKAGTVTRAGKIDPAAPIDNDARLLVGDALYFQKKWPELVALYEKLIKDYPKSIRLSEVRWRLAEAYRKQNKTAAVEAPLLRAIWIEDPLSKLAAEALARLDKVSPVSNGVKLYTVFTATELTTRGHALFDAMRNEDSEATFAAALKAPGLDDAVACDARFHLAQSVFKQRERARAAPFFVDAATACETAKNDDLHMKSLYQAGRTHSSAGEHEKAIAFFTAAEKAHPDHSYADDSRLRAAEAATSLKDDQRAIEFLSTLPDKYPDGDMEAEALWRLAYRAWKAKQWQTALGFLDKQIAAVPHEMRWDAEGQALYWRGRVLVKMGKKKDAQAAWAQTVREYPLSVYALFALNRLQASAPAQVKKLLAEIKKPLTGSSDAQAAQSAKLSFTARAEYADPRFQRAIVLLSIGMDADAARELEAAGFKPPAEKGKQVSADEAERLWAATLLMDKAGAWSQSHWIPRHTLTSYKLAWPVGDNQQRWRLSYPLGYVDLLAAQAKALGHPTELALAFVREESAFDPLRESFANAIGLMQMIFPTAERFAKGTGLKPTREVLRDPQSNVIIGSRFLNFLWKHFKGNAGLIVGGYNAGEGRIAEWLKVRGNLDLDDFIEAIPFDETRGYSKRVLNSYFVYRYLAYLESGKGEWYPKLSFKLK